MIKARGLARSFTSRRGTVEAVRGVDLDVADGELVGFLGPNGAGKTTTLRMLATLLRPTAGDAAVAGCDLRADPTGVRRHIGYVGQGSGAGLDQRVGEELVLQGRFYGLPTAESRRRAAHLIETLELTGLADRAVASLSGGQRRRLDVAMGVIHEPDLLFLDEPSAGLDPQSRANLWNHLRELHRRGTTVFLTTHYLDEADTLCQRILVIDGGTIVAEGRPDELKSRVAGDLVTLRVDGDGGAATTARVAESLPGATTVAPDGDAVTFRVPRGDSVLPTLLRELDSHGVAVSSVQTHRPSLDDVFLSLTGRSLRDAA